MEKKADSSTGKFHILVITDRQRLRSLFDFCTSLPLIQLSTASTIDEGIKIAVAKAPALLFVQERTGGLSGEIIARHFRQELKECRTRLFLFRAEEDAQTPGNRSLFTAIDVSLPDEELAAEVQSVVTSLLPGAKKATPRREKMTRQKSSPEIPCQSPQSDPETQGPDPEVDDIVEIRTNYSLPLAQPHESSRSAERSAVGSFREKLDVAMEISAPTINGENMAGYGRDVAAHRHRHVFHGTREEQPGQRSGAGIPDTENNHGKRWIVLSAALLSGITALFMFYGSTSAPKNAQKTVEPGTAKVSAGMNQGITMPPTAAAGTAEPDKNHARTPASVEDRKPGEEASVVTDAWYQKYAVRRGDSLVTILTNRFGLSTRMAESLMPEILAKNGITRRTILTIGQTILIPSAVKIQQAPGS
jgi:hypothetical protein